VVGAKVSEVLLPSVVACLALDDTVAVVAAVATLVVSAGAVVEAATVEHTAAGSGTQVLRKRPEPNSAEQR